MPSEKTILATFALSDLQGAARKLKVEADDRRRKDALVTALCKGRPCDWPSLLTIFSAAALKDVCSALALEPSQKSKAACIEALVGAANKKHVATTRVANKLSKSPAKAARPRALGAAADAAKARSQASKPKVEAPPATTTARAISRAEVLAKARAAKAKRLQPQSNTQPKASRAKQPLAGPACKPEVLSHSSDAKAPAVPAKTDPAPTDTSTPKKAAAKKGPLSWSEAAQMAAHRGQSAATMLRAAVPQASGTKEHDCQKCHKAVVVQACQVQACNNYYVAAPGRKICSECLFERNTISMDDFNDRLHEERQCTHCGVPMTHLGSTHAQLQEQSLQQ